MAETLSVVQECIDKKICLSAKINSLIDNMDRVRDEPDKDYSPIKS